MTNNIFFITPLTSSDLIIQIGCFFFPFLRDTLFLYFSFHLPGMCQGGVESHFPLEYLFPTHVNITTSGGPCAWKIQDESKQKHSPIPGSRYLFLHYYPAAEDSYLACLLSQPVSEHMPLISRKLHIAFY